MNKWRRAHPKMKGYFSKVVTMNRAQSYPQYLWCITDNLTLPSANFHLPVVVRVLEPSTRAVEAITAPQWCEGGVVGQGPGMRFHPEPWCSAET